MGCDIHMIVQVRKDGRWVTSEITPYRERNYEAFAMLADVRNRFGITPIAPQRGLPDDLDVREGEQLGDHSFSRLLLSELDPLGDYWRKSATLSGVVDVAGWLSFFASGRPREYSQGVSGACVVHVDQNTMRRIATEAVASGLSIGDWLVACRRAGAAHYTTVEWTETYRAAAVALWEWAWNLTLWCQGNDIERSDVRLVFGFDS